jgi:hypothetical protein
MDAKIRQYQHNLIYSGAATILFGVWGIVKACMILFLNESSYDLVESAQGLPIEVMYIIFGIVFFFLFGIAMLFRLYIGISAIQEGRGRKKRRIYVFITFLYLLVIAVMNGYMVYLDRTLNDCITIFLDVTCNICMVVIVYSSWSLRKLLKEKEEV